MIAIEFIKRNKDVPKELYKWLMEFVGYIVGTTSDQAADIAARSLPIVAPLPNAISVYFVSQSALGFNQWQALAFACAIEIAMFAVIEIALIMFDGLLSDERRYKGAFRLSLCVSVGVLALIIGFVVFVEISHEKGHPVLAGMPLLSGASAIMLALKRWHVRNEKRTEIQMGGESVKQITLLTNEISLLKSENAELMSTLRKRSEAANEAENKRREAEGLAEGLAEDLTELEKKIAVLETKLMMTQEQSTRVSEPFPSARTPERSGVPAKQRRIEVLRRLAKTSAKGEANFTQWGTELGTSDTTIRNDLEWLIKNRYWQNGSDWKVTDEGKGLLSYRG